MDRICVFYAKNDSELLWLIESGVDCDENRLKNYVIDRIDVGYVQNETELLWLIGPCPIYNRN